MYTYLQRMQVYRHIHALVLLGNSKQGQFYILGQLYILGYVELAKSLVKSGGLPRENEWNETLSHTNTSLAMQIAKMETTVPVPVWEPYPGTQSFKGIQEQTVEA